MHENLLLIPGFLFAAMLLGMLVRRIRIAYPILPVLAGLAHKVLTVRVPVCN